MTRLASATQGAWLGACYRDRDLERVMRMRVDAPDIDRIRYAVDQLGSDLSLPPRGRWALSIETAFEDRPIERRERSDHAAHVHRHVRSPFSRVGIGPGRCGPSLRTPPDGGLTEQVDRPNAS